jgi:hypothetical protein
MHNIPQPTGGEFLSALEQAEGEAIDAAPLRPSIYDNILYQ